jgi:hypothetical protein
MKGYKGFDKDMKCKDFQYEVGKTYKTDEAKLCSTGFHFCENPLDVLSYYGLSNGNQYAEVEAENVSNEKEKDSKRVSKEITIKAKVDFKGLIAAGIEFTLREVHSATSGDSAHSATSGYSAHSATSGYSAHSATSGNSAHSATSGNSANSATSGDYANSATSGNSANSATSGYSANSATSGDYANSATSGDSAHSATSGDYANSATSGNYAHSATSGNNSIACAIGINSHAKSIKGNWLVLSEYDDNYKVICIKTVKVDGKKIKADTWYMLKDKKFCEVK